MLQTLSSLPECNGFRKSVLFLIFATIAFGGGTRAQQSLPDAPSATKTKLSRSSEAAWPRTFTSENDTFTIYPPQVDKWEGNLIDLYCAVELKEAKTSAPKYGVVWFQARTEVDKVNRSVTFSELKILKVKFPAAASKEVALRPCWSGRYLGQSRLYRSTASRQHSKRTMKE